MQKVILKCISMLLILNLFGCQNNLSKSPSYQSSFEKQLVPSIQVTSEPRYFSIEDRMEHYAVPGMSIAIVKDGKIVFHKGYGYARLADSVRVDEQTIFQSGSIAKSITAFAVIRLIEKGVLDLDENVETYLKTWSLPENPFTKETPVTLRMLLSHTAGVNNNNHKGFPQNGPSPSLNQLLDGYEDFKAVSIDTAPGLRYKYSNNGYGVIQRILEDVTGQTFNEIVTQEVLKPLKMRQSTFEEKQHNAENLSVSYAYNRSGEMVDGYWYNASVKASGEMWTTAEDLAKFMLGMQACLVSDQGLISKDHAIEMITRVKADYGLGFDVKNEGDSTVFYHTGKNVGFTNLIMASAQGKNGVVILTNGDNGGYLFSEITRGISELEKWDFMKPRMVEDVEVDGSILETYLGTYKLDFDGEIYTFVVERDGPNLTLLDPDEAAYYPIRATSKTDFVAIDDGENVKFITNPDQSITLLWDDDYNFKRVVDQ
ncbi:MAG: serine hydrolase domain-containing protein [Bacteroidota bacterium]